MRELVCTRIVEYRERNKKGKWIIVHRRCGRQAAEVTLSGHLIKAKAVLCEEHLGWAMREIELSGQSYPMLFDDAFQTSKTRKWKNGDTYDIEIANYY